MASGKINLKGNTTVQGNLNAKSSNVGVSKKEENFKQWEFFKNVEGVLTETITKMLNIPSTLFTPAFSLPSKAQFANILKTIAIIKAVMYKFRQIDEALHKNKNTTSDRKRIARMEILTALEKNKWQVNVHRKDGGQ